MDQQDVLTLVGEHSPHLRKNVEQTIRKEQAAANEWKAENARLRNELLKYGRALDQIKALGDQVTVAEAKRIAGEALQ